MKILKLIKYVLVVFLCLPFVDLMVMFSLFCKAYKKLGRVPKYGDPDPNDLGFNTHVELSHITFNFVAIAFFMLVISIIFRIFSKRNLMGIECKFFVFSFVVLMIELLLLVSPIMLWYWD